VKVDRKIQIKVFFDAFASVNSSKDSWAKSFYSPSPDSFFPFLNTKCGSTKSKGSKKNPAFALTLKTTKQP
jgi:hypothetical protein